MRSFLLGLVIGGAIALPLGVNLGRGAPLLSNPFAERTMAAGMRDTAQRAGEAVRAQAERATQEVRESAEKAVDAAKQAAERAADAMTRERASRHRLPAGGRGTAAPFADALESAGEEE